MDFFLFLESLCFYMTVLKWAFIHPGPGSTQAVKLYRFRNRHEGNSLPFCKYPAFVTTFSVEGKYLLVWDQETWCLYNCVDTCVRDTAKTLSDTGSHGISSDVSPSVTKALSASTADAIHGEPSCVCRVLEKWTLLCAPLRAGFMSQSSGQGSHGGKVVTSPSPSRTHIFLSLFPPLDFCPTHLSLSN